jgi:glycosyltransferase involved in cell wall biosynthesis
MAAPQFTVIVPTFDHAETLWFSLESALAQTLPDFELVVVGDGAPARTAKIVNAFAARDPRVRYVPHPKGARHGEAERHRVLEQAQGAYVAYLSDDDLWFPDHLATLAALLADHDLAHTMQIDVTPDGQAHSWMFDADTDPGALEAMRRNANGFGLASGGHTLAAYRRLPAGWRPAPAGMNSDTYFWLQFLDQPWCRYASHKWPNVIHLSRIPKQWPAVRRAAELAAYAARLADPAWREELVRRTLLDVHARAVRDASLALSAAASPEPYLIGECIRFALRGNAHRYEVSGTYEREPWGVWVRGTMRVVLRPRPLPKPAAAAPERLVLTLELVHLLAGPARPVSAVRISVNGKFLARIDERLPDARSYELELPRSRRAAGTPFTIEIEGEDPASPLALGLSGDPRELAVGVLSLSIGPRTASSDPPPSASTAPRRARSGRRSQRSNGPTPRR